MFYSYPYLGKSTIFQMGWNHQVYSLYISSGNLSWLEIASFPNRKHLFKRSMCCCCVWIPRGYVCVSVFIYTIHIICIYAEMLFLSGCSDHHIGPSEATVWILFVGSLGQPSTTSSRVSRLQFTASLYLCYPLLGGMEFDKKMLNWTNHPKSQSTYSMYLV